MMAAWKIAPALAAGNTVVIKPSEQTPLTHAAAGPGGGRDLPEGRAQRHHRPRRQRSASRWSSTRRWRWSALTGDVGTGRKILQAATGTLKRTHLELGGKAPVIVFDDADLDAVVEGLRTFGYYNAGQDCTAACRVYAGAKVYDKLVADLSQRGQDHQGGRCRTTPTPRSAR